MLKNWIKIAFKNFKADKFNFFINLFGLAIGLVGLVISILHYTDEGLYDSWNELGEHIYINELYSEKSKGNTSPPPLGPLVKAEIEEVEDYTLTESWHFETLLKSNYNSSFTDRLLAVQENFFQLFPFEFVLGSPKNAFKNNGMTLSEKTAIALFGNSNPVGETITMHDTKFVVTGVYKIPPKSSIEPNIIIQSGAHLDEPNNWGYQSFYLFYKLKPNSNIEKIEEKILQLMWKNSFEKDLKEMGMTRAQAEELFGNPQISLTKLSDIRLHSESGNGIFGNGGNYILLLIVVGLSTIILFSSCINFINTTIANSLKRAKEVSVRKVLGSSKPSIILQFLIETTIICLLALLVSLVLVEFLIPYVNDFLGKEMEFNNWTLLLLLAIGLFFVILFSGLIPAFYLSNFEPSAILKGSFSRSKKGILIRNGILFLQFMISAFFLIGSLIVYQQVSYMSKKDLGFSGDQILLINFKHLQEGIDVRGKYLKAKALFEKFPEVKEVTTSLTTPNGEQEFGSIVKTKDKQVRAEIVGIEYNYLDILNIRLIEGRQFDSKLASDTISNCIVNETFVKKMLLEEPIRTQVTHGFDTIPYNIIGVVKDYHTRGFDRKIEPVIIVHYNTTDWLHNTIQNVQLKIDTQNLPATLEKLEKVWVTEIEQGYPFDYTFLNKQFAKSYELFKKQKNIFFFLSLIVVLVALLGLYAVTSYIIKQRLREVAIRKVLGAESNQIIYQLSKEFYWIVCIAIVASMPLIYFLTQGWLENFQYRIDMPVLPYVIGFVLLGSLTLLVVSTRAYKATLIDMVTYLKYE